MNPMSETPQNPPKPKFYRARLDAKGLPHRIHPREG